MAAGPEVEEAGEVVACPRCGREVKQKSMIPILAEDGVGHVYVCVECARALITPDDEPAKPAEVASGG